MPIIIEGKTPLRGTVSVSGAFNSAIKLIFTSMFSNEDIILENVPRVESIQTDIELIKGIGGKAEWIGNNRLLLNGAHLNNFEIPLELGSKYRETFLLVGPLLFRFGKASIPVTREAPINRILSTWKSLGFDVVQDSDWIHIASGKPKATEVSFKTSTHTGTENAIICSLFIEGETIINNASEESEIEDLIAFANLIGAKVTRLEARKLKVQGTNVFKGCTFSIQPDKNEVAAFSTAAILTGGNIAISGVNKLHMVPFINFLSKIGANYEVQDKELRVWESKNLSPINLVVASSPGFVPNWQAFATLILCKASGESTILDSVYTNRFGYVQDLNRMGADIELVKPSTRGITPIISDDSYDFVKFGEPNILAVVKAPIKLYAEKFHIIESRYANILVLAALAAEGKSEINGYTSLHEKTENFFDKLISLGAKISKI